MVRCSEIRNVEIRPFLTPSLMVEHQKSGSNPATLAIEYQPDIGLYSQYRDFLYLVVIEKS